MVKSNWIVIYVFTYCIYKSDARQDEMIEFYDDDNNLHLINLTVPEVSELVTFLNSPKLDDVGFWLYTRKNKDNYEELRIDNLSNVTYFDPDNPLIVVTHGWLSSGLSRSTQWIKNAYLETREVNVLVVNWEKDAAYKLYFWSAYLTTDVAKKICSMVLALSREYNLLGEDMHFIGHSLGAHVVGVAGIKLRSEEFIIGRVTGLDPALPFFEHPQTLPPITIESGEFVDIIHTNVGALGYKSSIGHADFYPNGGYYQPHCCHNWKLLSCAHACSYTYFEETIRGIAYLSTRCDTYFYYLIGFCNNNDEQLMGLPKTTARGSYYINILR